MGVQLNRKAYFVHYLILLKAKQLLGKRSQSVKAAYCMIPTA